MRNGMPQLVGFGATPWSQTNTAEKGLIIGGGAMALLAIGATITRSPTVTKIGAGSAAAAALALTVLGLVRAAQINQVAAAPDAVRELNSATFMDTIAAGSLFTSAAVALLFMPTR